MRFLAAIILLTVTPALAQDLNAAMTLCRSHQNPPVRVSTGTNGQTVVTPLPRFQSGFETCNEVEARWSAAGSAAAAQQKQSDMQQLNTLLSR